MDALPRDLPRSHSPLVHTRKHRPVQAQQADFQAIFANGSPGSTIHILRLRRIRFYTSIAASG